MIYFSTADFCLAGVKEDCISVNGFVTLLLEGEVTDMKEAEEEREGAVAFTKKSIKKTFKETDEKVYLVQKLSEARNQGYQSAEESDQSTIEGSTIAGVLAVGLLVAGAAFVYRKKKVNASSKTREVAGNVEGIPVAEAKVIKDDKKGKKDEKKNENETVPIATVVEELPVQNHDDNENEGSVVCASAGQPTNGNFWGQDIFCGSISP